MWEGDLPSYSLRYSKLFSSCLQTVNTLSVLTACTVGHLHRRQISLGSGKPGNNQSPAAQGKRSPWPSTIPGCHGRAQPCPQGSADVGSLWACSANPQAVTDVLSWTQLSAPQHRLQRLGHWGSTGDPLGMHWGTAGEPLFFLL